MNMWNFYLPVEVHFGEKTLADIGRIMENKGYQNAVLVCDATSVKLGLAEKVMRYAEGRIVAMFSGVEPNPTIDNVDDCLLTIQDKTIECVVALGGGSSIDCGKSIAAARRMGLSASQLLDYGTIYNAFPVIAIPTTAGTGSEVTAGAVLSDHKRNLKQAIFGPGLFAKVAIDDPELTYSCPNFVTASSGIDVLAHSLDSLTSVKTNASTIGTAIYAAKIAFFYLERAYKDGADVVARRYMMEASLAAGLAFSQTGTTGSHACSYILTSKYGIPHGEACAFTLDWWYRKNAEVRPELNDYARMIGFSNAADLSNKLNELKKALNLRTHLRQIVADESEINEIVDNSMASSNMCNNIWHASREDVLKMFKEKM